MKYAYARVSTDGQRADAQVLQPYLVRTGAGEVPLDCTPATCD